MLCGGRESWEKGERYDRGTDEFVICVCVCLEELGNALGKVGLSTPLRSMEHNCLVPHHLKRHKRRDDDGCKGSHYHGDVVV